MDTTLHMDSHAASCGVRLSTASHTETNQKNPNARYNRCIYRGHPPLMPGALLLAMTPWDDPR